MDKNDSELAKAKRDLRNWRYLAAVVVVLVAIVVVLAGVPFLIS